MGMEEKPGSTRIIMILPEGTRVKKGDLVCELESGTFRDELTAQLIRHAQAKSWVERAQTILDVAEIELREYRDGVYPQDVQQIESTIKNNRTQDEQNRVTLEWSQDMQAKGLRAASQVLGDQLLRERSQITLNESIEARKRLVEFSGPRIIKSLEAKIAAVNADLLSQKAAFQVEDDRMKRLEKAAASCKLYAPSDGIVVYARNTNGWGRVEDQITNGVTVREGQAIFSLPDPKNMTVQVKINESKIGAMKEGLAATIRVDAFPDEKLTGRLIEIKPIPAPANIISDVHLYSAVVSLDPVKFDGLRTGMSAEVAFQLGERDDAVRVPIQSIRWVDGDPYVASQPRTGQLEWKKLELGLIGPVYAQVVSGLEPGEAVAASPEKLPAFRPAPTMVANANGN